MVERSGTGLWVMAACIACSSPDDADLFAPASNNSTPSVGPGATITATSQGSPAVSTSDGGASSTAITSSATGTGGSATSSASGGAGGGAGGSGGASADGTGGSGAASGGSGGGGGSLGTGGTSAVDSATGGSGGEAPTLVTLEFEEDEDCVALVCPDRAPYLVGCDITFSEFNREYACLAVEGSVVFVKSGENCSGSVVTAGSSVVCSSMELQGGITAEECVTNKEDLHIVDDRCDCEAAAYIDGCDEG